MKKLLFLLLAVLPVAAQITPPAPPVPGNVYTASQYGQWGLYTYQGNTVTGATSLFVSPYNSSGPNIPTFKVGLPLTFERGTARAETVNIVALNICNSGTQNCVTSQSCNPGSQICQVFGVFSFLHPQLAVVQSGTFGLQDSINYAMGQANGTVLIDQTWGGSTGMITAAQGSTAVAIQDNRSGTPQNYQWQGSSYVLVSGGGGGGSPGNPASSLQMNNAGNFGGTNLYPILSSMTVAQINSLFAGITPGTGTVVIPDGTNIQSPGVINTNVGTYSLSKTDNYIQATGKGVACNAGGLYLTFTSGSNQVIVGSDPYIAVGNTMFVANRSGYTYGATQSTWEPTITAFNPTFPGTVTLSSNAPFSYTGWVSVGPDSTTAMQNLMNAAGQSYPISLPTGCSIMTKTLSWSNSQSLVGLSAIGANIIGPPGYDTLQSPDVSNQGAKGPGLRLENVTFSEDTRIDAALGFTDYGSNGSPTTVPPVYRPLCVGCQSANNPLAPGWITGAKNGVASTTQNSAVICTPNSETPPAVGQTIIFPYFATVFSATVSSTAGSCGGGTTARTMSSALPNTAGYTTTQSEWFTGSAIQSTTTTIPSTGIAYPLTIFLTLPTNPVPGYESNFASHGHIKLCGSEFDYEGVNGYSSPYQIVLRKGPTTSNGCSGTTPIAPLNPCAAKNLFGSTSDQPWPVVPTINSGDSTPSGATQFPGWCGGSAAISFPATNLNAYVGTGLVNETLHDVTIQSGQGYPQEANGGTAGNTMGVYQAGNYTGYAVTYDGFRITNTTYGWAQGPASSGQHGIVSVATTSTGNHWTNCSIHAGHPIMLVNAENGGIDRCDVYTEFASPYDGTTVGEGQALVMGETLDEQTGNQVTNVSLFQVTKFTGEPETNSANLYEIPPYLESMCFTCDFSNDQFEGAFQIWNGSNQTVEGSSQMAVPAINYGFNNHFKGINGLAIGMVYNTWSQGGNNNQFYNWGTLSDCTAQAATSGPAIPCNAGFGEPADTFATGNTAHPYLSKTSGMIRPGEWNTNGSFDTQPMTTGFTVDTTEPFWGSYASCNLGGSAACTPNHFEQNNNGYIYIGPQNRLVDGAYVLVADFKTVSAASSFTLTIATASANGCTGATAGAYSVPTTTTWTPYSSQPFTFAGKAGCTLSVTFGSGTTTDTLEVGAFTLVPVPQWQLLQVASPTIGAACPTNGTLVGMDTTNLYGCANGVIKQLAWGSSGGMVYPSAGVANSNGSAWATSYQVGTAANNLVQLNSSSALPAVSGANLTNLTAANIALGTAGINISGNANTANTATSATTANALGAASAIPNGSTATTQTCGDNSTKLATTAYVAGCASAGSSPIFTHTLSGATPTAVVNSATVAALDTEYLPLSVNVTSFTLPAAAAIADGEILTIVIAQPASGGPYTLPTGTALSPLTAGSGTTLINTIPGGCPSIGTTASATAPSELLLSVTYKASLTQYIILGCQTGSPAQSSVVEFGVSAVTSAPGIYAANQPLATFTPINAGHIASIQGVYGSGTCTSPPTINVFDVTQSTSGTALTLTTSGRAFQAETLTFAAGDDVRLEVTVAGSGCSGGFHSVSMQVAEP